MEDWINFLTFRSLISPYALLGFYYLGAVIMPLAVWAIWFWLTHRFGWFSQARDEVGVLSDQMLTPKQRDWLLLACLLCFLMMELFWRMLFEFLIAYIHMAEDIQALVRMPR